MSVIPAFELGLWNAWIFILLVLLPLPLVALLRKGTFKKTASASWLFLLLSIVLIITHFYNAVPEERECLEVYGNAYREYINRTPRWVGIPKSEKK